MSPAGLGQPPWAGFAALLGLGQRFLVSQLLCRGTFAGLCSLRAVPDVLGLTIQLFAQNVGVVLANASPWSEES